MKHPGILWLLILLLPATNAKAAPPDSSYYRQVTLIYQNDFFSSSDYYFTQGVEADFIFPFVKKSPFSHLLIREGKNAVNQFGLFIRQECFTPTSIRSDTVLTGDRPFAAVLYLGHKLASVNTEKKQRLSTEFVVGVLGRCAGCRKSQEKIHQWLDNIAPIGWQYQVSNSFVLNYSVNYEKMIWGMKYFESIGSLGGEAGTLYNNAGFGVMIRAGKIDPYFGSATQAHNKFQYYGFLSGDARGILYNATMEGSLFNNKSIYTIPSSNIERIVFSATAGLRLSYRGLLLEYSKTFLSPEFSGGLSHGWGNIGIYMQW